MTEINVRNLGDFSAQQVFDAVAKHLLKQNARSMAKITICGKEGNVVEAHCAYHGDNNTKCAAGIFLTDEDMKNPRIKNTGQGWGGVCDIFSPISRITTPHEILIGCLQGKVHDPNRYADETHIKEWSDVFALRLVRVAENFGLTFNREELMKEI